MNASASPQSAPERARNYARALAEGRFGHVVYLDVESTGLDRRAEAISLGLVSRLGVAHTHLLRPSARASWSIEAERVHGFGRDDVQQHRPITDIAPRLFALAQKCRIIAHNAAFDRRVLGQSLNAASLPGVAPIAWHCTLDLARIVWPGQRCDLDSCLERIGIPRREAGARHDAGVDAALCRSVLRGIAGLDPEDPRGLAPRVSQ